MRTHGKECFLWCFLFNVLLGNFGPDNPWPCPFILSIHSYDLNNETPVFCLLAVLLYIIAAQEECSSVSERTLLHSRDEDGPFSPHMLGHLDRITRMFRISPGVTAPCCALNTLIWHVMSGSNKPPISEIYSLTEAHRETVKGLLQMRHSPRRPLMKNKEFLPSYVLLFWECNPD